MQVWICGKIINYENKAWEFAGVFSTEALAIAACKKDLYFIGPAEMDSAPPSKTVDWPGAYYPRLEKKPL